MIAIYGKHDRAIGQSGKMPEGLIIKRDRVRFGQLTHGKSLIMGRLTHESIGRVLPGRQNIVVSSHNDFPDGVEVVRSLVEAYDRANSIPIVIGGSRLYQEALPHTDTIFATEVDGCFPEADAFFPEIPPEPTFMEAPGARQHMRPDVLGGFAYDFTIYFRHLDREITYESFV